MNRNMPIHAFVFPCYNEEDMLPVAFGIVVPLLEELIEAKCIAENSFALFVDDGSQDDTWKVITECANKNKLCKGLKLAGNVGHQNALFAGMMEVLEQGVDCMISLDVDMQDDISAARKMIEDFKCGVDIVYGVRSNRVTDTFFKRSTASLYYKLMRWLNINIIPQHSDYRLCGKNVLSAIGQYKESELFLRAIFPSLGFINSSVFYSRKHRVRGESKYPVRRMISFAWRGITSFSSMPLRVTGLFSILFIFLAFVQAAVIVHTKYSGNAVSGWASVMLVLLIFSSVQLFCLALIGEYVAKMFIEVKHRPRYIVDKRVGY